MNFAEIFSSNDDIAAISTGGVHSAIAVIRCSGPEVIEKINQLFIAKNPSKSLLNLKSGCSIFGKLFSQGEMIDEVIISVYHSPKSFTGENIVEISCHGSLYIQKLIINILNINKIRTAFPGEFTLRAWKNGKYDLAQAEAIADLIESNSEKSHQIALQHLKGSYSDAIMELRSEFVNLSSLIELELDFSEEDVVFADRKQFLNIINTLKIKIISLIDSYKLGKVIKEGIPVVILGKPNVGKSTLLNKLLNEDKAITSEIPGTTRDIIEDKFTIDGVLFRFIDTAGIRKTSDMVENLGIDRTLKAVNAADIVIYLTESEDIDQSFFDDYQINIETKYLIKVVNKIDLKASRPQSDEELYISAKTGENLDKLMDRIRDYIKSFDIENQHIVTSSQHVFLLEKTLDSLREIEEGFRNKLSVDLIAIDLRIAANYLGSITGQIQNEDILKNIFSKFCIGK